MNSLARVINLPASRSWSEEACQAELTDPNPDSSPVTGDSRTAFAVRYPESPEARARLLALGLGTEWLTVEEKIERSELT